MQFLFNDGHITTNCTPGSSASIMPSVREPPRKISCNSCVQGRPSPWLFYAFFTIPKCVFAAILGDGIQGPVPSDRNIGCSFYILMISAYQPYNRKNTFGGSTDSKDFSLFWNIKTPEATCRQFKQMKDTPSDHPKPMQDENDPLLHLCRDYYTAYFPTIH